MKKCDLTMARGVCLPRLLTSCRGYALHAAALIGLCVSLVGFAASAAWAGSPPEAGKHYTIYLLVGQSNMDGRGDAADLTGDLADWTGINENVLINYACGGYEHPLKASEGLTPLQPGCSEKNNRFGPELSFGRSLAKARPKENIILVKVSEGGTNLYADWDPDRKGSLYHNLLALLRQTRTEIEQQGARSDLAAVLWLQGEADARSGFAGHYGQNLEKFISRLRTDTATEDLPFVIGSICADNEKFTSVIEQSQELARSSPTIHFVSGEGLTAFDANVHYDARSQIEIGQRFAKTILEIQVPARQ